MVLGMSHGLKSRSKDKKVPYSGTGRKSIDVFFEKWESPLQSFGFRLNGIASEMYTLFMFELIYNPQLGISLI